MHQDRGRLARGRALYPAVGALPVKPNHDCGLRGNRAMRLPKTTYQWALRHLIREGDTDLFPPLFEIEAFRYSWKPLLDELSQLDISMYHWKGGRRFIVPKDALAFRSATQLDPLDSLMLAALLRKYGDKIESSRIAVVHRRIFSYRFNPTPDGLFYGKSSLWADFWRDSLERASASGCGWVAVTDITDYYNQIYHHVLENELKAARLPLAAVKSVMSLLSNLSSGVSRGIPVGPHSVHLLAECALIPTDQSLLTRGYNFCRYVDDLHFFCRTREEAEIALYDLADVLDKQQKLTIQKQKTKVMPTEEFQKIARDMLLDRPLNDEEAMLIAMIRKYSADDPYQLVGLASLSDKDLETVDSAKLKRLFDLYLAQTPVDYPRIGWLLRRLAQIAAPGAIEYVLDHMALLTPVLGNVARYIMRATMNYQGSLEDLGQRIVEALKTPLIDHSEYLQLVLYSILSGVPALNHVDAMSSRYLRASPAVRREIIRAAGAAELSAWVKERKDEFHTADPWLRRAMLSAAPCLPGDEANHWLRKLRYDLSTTEKLVARWVFRDRSAKLGNISL
jgi:Reverse transcriptase (RNA-dependent DNA polymerase)